MIQDLSVFFSTESIIVFILVLTRLSGMLASAPLFSTFPSPMQLKAGLAALTAFIIYPFVIQVSDFTMPTNLIGLTGLLLKEMMVGIMIGFSASLIFTGIQVGGHLLSIQMGLAIAQALDPITRSQIPIIGQFYLFLASLIFIYINGHHWLFSSIHESYMSIPIGMNFDFAGPIIEQLIMFFSRLFASAFSLVMPIFEILLLITMLMGFMAKIMPQMNIFMVVMPFKIYVGLSLVAILMPPTAVYMMKFINTMLIDLNGIFMIS